MNDEKIKLLKDEAKRVYGNNVKSTQDAIIFADSIFESTNQQISYNTIRRVYGLVSYKGKHPSKSTLDILANYCGFVSFSDFSDNFNIQNNQIENYNESYLKFYRNKKVDFEIVNKFCNQKQDFHTFDFLKKSIHIAFTFEDVDFLKNLFELNCVFKNKSYLYFHQNYLIQDVGALLRNFPHLQKQLWSHWSRQKNARLLYFELFVDMDNLINSHFYAMEMYLKYSTSQQDIAFANSLLFFRDFLMDNRLSSMDRFQILCDIELKNIHPIPRARCLISQLLFTNPSVELLEKIKYWSDFEMKNKKSAPPFFNIWMMEGLIMVQQYNIVLQLSKSIESDSNFIDNRINRGLIQRAKTYQAIALIRTGKNTEGQNLYKEINSAEYNLFSILYDNLFYLALKYFITNDAKIKDEGKNKAKEIGYQKLFKMLIQK